MHRINYLKTRIDLAIGEKAKVSKEIQASLELPTRYITATAKSTCEGCMFAAASVACESNLPLECTSNSRKDKTSVIFVPLT